MDMIEYYLEFFSILMFMVILVITIHAVAVIALSYAETGAPLFYLENFYRNVYHINL